MKLRQKLFIFSIGYIFIWIAFMVIFMDKSFIKGYQTLEDKEFDWKIERARNGINTLIKTRETIIKDWTKWTYAYQYVKGNESDFIEENITESLFIDLEINHVLFFDYKNQLLYSQGYDLETNEFDIVPESLISEIRQYKDQSGLLYIDDKPLAFSAFQVTDSDGLNEPLGLFVFSFYLNEDHFKYLSSELKEQISISSTHYKLENDNSTTFLNKSDSYSVAEYYFPYLNTDFVMKVDTLLSHEITNLGREMIKESLWIFIISFLVLNSVVYLGVKQSVLRIQKISSEVSHISHSRDLKRRLDVKGTDELGILSEDINLMLNKIEKMNQQLTEHATFDMMTGLLNRRIGLEKLSHLIEAANEKQFDLTICFIDINDLKNVNDEYGHSAGDQLIVDVSNIVEESTRSTDIFCRLGGDEFLIIFPYCDYHNALELMTRIDEDINAFNKSGTRQYSVSISKGISEYDGVMSLDKFVESADVKMYNDKRTIKANRSKT